MSRVSLRICYTDGKLHNEMKRGTSHGLPRRAVIFDLDGTLRDSRVATRTAVEHALQSHLGYVPSWEQIAPHMHAAVVVREYLAPHVPLERFVATFDDKYNSLSHTIS